MIIAVATTRGGLDDVVSPVFGRAPTFTIVTVEGNEIKSSDVIQNQFYMGRGGAGIAAAQMIVSKGAKVLISGNVGPNSYAVLSQAGIKLYSAYGMKVKDAVMSYLEGKLSPITAPVGGPGFGRGFGGGFGRGGAGYGRGRGGGWF